jgi:prepilin-type N-terminal cleavage/methylation domain-containing protein
MKSETRNPKAERNPKSEIRNDFIAAQPRLRLNSGFGFRPYFGLRSSAFRFRSPAFTLIELLIVISIIAILAAMIIPISGAVSRSKIRAKARVELERVATAIDLYKAKLGHYPPDNLGNPATNQLYFELLGTTFTNGTYVTIDGSAQIRQSSLPTVFGLNPNGTAKVGGIINCTQASSGDESRVASSFLTGLKPDEVATIATGPDNVKLLVAGVPGPVGRLNTIAYVSSSPTNNPNSYDLWVDIVISGRTNRLSNWSKEAITLP